MAECGYGSPAGLTPEPCPRPHDPASRSIRPHLDQSEVGLQGTKCLHTARVLHFLWGSVHLPNSTLWYIPYVLYPIFVELSQLFNA